jgi:hypothetical protein
MGRKRRIVTKSLGDDLQKALVEGDLKSRFRLIGNESQSGSSAQSSFLIKPECFYYGKSCKLFKMSGKLENMKRTVKLILLLMDQSGRQAGSFAETS